MSKEYQLLKKETSITPDEEKAILSSYREAFQLCQNEFKMDRWNCPEPRQIAKAKHPISLTSVYKSASRETSYVYSITVVTMVHHLMKSCEMGKGTNCPCGHRDEFTNTVLPCKENLKHGFKRARSFIRRLDYEHVKDERRREFNSRNFMSGIEVLKDDLKLVCRCHGVSGQCTTKNCWKSTPASLKKISQNLKKLYKKAKKLTNNPTKKVIVPSLKKAGRSFHKITVNATNLVYLDDSPNYCKRNKKLGIPGTLNRQCDHYVDSTCDNLCSSCGYRKHSYVREIKNAKCNCKFIWCCKVTCQECVEHKIYAKCASVS